MDSIQDCKNKDKWLALEPDYFVKARDPFLSGWGQAPVNSYVIVLCNTNHDVYRVMDGLERSKMKNITRNTISGINSFPKQAGCHYSLYFAPETKWWEEDGIYSYWDEEAKVTRGNKEKFYEDRLSGANKLYGKKTIVNIRKMF